METENHDTGNRQDLPLEFDPPSGHPAAPDPSPAPQPGNVRTGALIPPDNCRTTGGDAPAPRRPAPLITPLPTRRAETLNAQNNAEESRVRTVPVSAFPGSPKLAEPRPQVPFGRYLAEQRKKLNLTLEQVDNATLIRKSYLEALEREDLDKLPPAVYVVAYVRKLGRYYQMPAPKIEELVSELKQHLEYSVPEELLNRLEINTEPCEENARTMHKILWTLGIGVPLLLVAIVVAILLSSRVTTAEKPTAAASERIAESRIYPLLDTPTLSMPELPAQ